jgi:hypothetical protein
MESTENRMKNSDMYDRIFKVFPYRFRLESEMHVISQRNVTLVTGLTTIDRISCYFCFSYFLGKLRFILQSYGNKLQQQHGQPS